MKNLESYYRGVTFAPGDIGRIVAALVADPQEVYDYREAVWGLIMTMLAWGDYRSSLDAFRLMVDVLVEVDQGLGKPVLAPEKITHDNEP